MRGYLEYQALVGVAPVLIGKVVEYLAYKDGECRTFASKSLADGFSKLIERRVTNEDAVIKSTAAFKEYHCKVEKLWYADLREEYGSLNDKTFAICYVKAHQIADGSGLDSITEAMEEMVTFLNDAILHMHIRKHEVQARL